MITTEQAKLNKVGGWDVVLSDQVIYYSEISRIQVAAQLCKHAFTMVNDSSIFQFREQRKAEAEEWAKWLANGGRLDRDPVPPSDCAFHQLERRHLDCFKIGSAIEISLKARLLLASCLIHYYNDSSHILSKEQKQRPILICEFVHNSTSYHNGRYNLYTDICDRTLGFELMIKKPCYRSLLNLSEPELTFIDEIRKQRNAIHLPTSSGEAIEIPFSTSLGGEYFDFLTALLNKLIVDVYNAHNWRKEVLHAF